MNLPASQVLLVEDDLHMPEVLAGLLHDDNITLTSAKDASTGLSLARAQPFDLILLDLGLPGVNGFELLRQLKESLERFGQVIHGSKLEPAELIGRAVPSGEDDDWDHLGFEGFLELPQQFKPVEDRKSKVDQDQIERLRAREAKARGGVFGTSEGDVIIVQETGQDLRHVKIVFDQQDLGRGQIHSLAFSVLAICMVQSTTSRSWLSTFNTNPCWRPI